MLNIKHFSLAAQRYNRMLTSSASVITILNDREVKEDDVCTHLQK